MALETSELPVPPSGFNPIGQEFLENPRDWFRRAQKESPVFFSPDFGFWGLTRLEDIESALKDWETFSSERIASVQVPPEFRDRVPEGFFATGALVSQDPPRHTKRRKLINRGFTRGEMTKLSDPIEAICNDLIDQFIDDGSCDLMQEYCYEVSLRSIVSLIGLPTDDLPLLRQLADDQGAVVSDAIKPMSDEERSARWERVVAARDYLKAVATDRIKNPKDDLITTMVTSVDEDGSPVLTPDQTVTHLTELVFAGTDTTANLMASLVRILDQDPGQLERLKADPGLWDAAVEEGLRIRSAANGVFRVTKRDVDVSGVTIPAGSTVWLGIGAAGVDDDSFDDPLRFDLDRANAKDHVGFGKGRHFCIGSPLTRLEAPIGMRVLYDRIPDLKVDPDQDFVYDPVLVAVILKKLEVTW